MNLLYRSLVAVVGIPVIYLIVRWGSWYFVAFVVLQSALAAPLDDFVTTWKTDNPGFSNSTSIAVPMFGGPYDVDWDNDGFFEETELNGGVTHDFGVAGTYTIRIQGSYTSFRLGSSGDPEKIIPSPLAQALSRVM